MSSLGGVGLSVGRPSVPKHFTGEKTLFEKAYKLTSPNALGLEHSPFASTTVEFTLSIVYKIPS